MCISLQMKIFGLFEVIMFSSSWHTKSNSGTLFWKHNIWRVPSNESQLCWKRSGMQHKLVDKCAILAIYVCLVRRPLWIVRYLLGRKEVKNQEWWKGDGFPGVIPRSCFLWQQLGGMGWDCLSQMPNALQLTWLSYLYYDSLMLHETRNSSFGLSVISARS